MPDLEKIMKKSLVGKQPILKITPFCLSELELGKYLDRTLPISQKEKIEKHLADCGYCLDLLVVAKDAIENSKKKVSLSQSLAKQKWFIFSMLSFLLSFFIKRYFFQFLTLSLILGIKWALSGEGSKNLVMIFRGLSHKESEDEAKEKTFVRK